MHSTHRGRRFGLKPVGLSLSALLIVGSLLVPAAALAVNHRTFRIAPATTNTSLGATFTVQVVGNADVDTSGASASVVFDKNRLQLTDVSNAGNDWTAAGGAYAGFPLTAAEKTTFINNANSAGKTPNIGATFINGSSFLAPGDHTLFSVTFQVIALGSSSLDLPVGTGNAEFLDGRSGTYGEVLTGVISTSGTVDAPAPTPTPTPTPTPVPTPTPTLAPANGTTNVTGTVDAGFLGITVPANVTIPLNRLTTNTANVPVTVFSNIAWTLNVSDPKAVNRGKMTDGAKVLQAYLMASVPPGAAGQMDLPTGYNVKTGSGSENFPVQLDQYVGSADPPGNYAISLVFQATSGF